MNYFSLLGIVGWSWVCLFWGYSLCNKRPSWGGLGKRLIKWKFPNVYCRQLLYHHPVIYPTLYVIPQISGLLFSLAWHIPAVCSFDTRQSMWLMDYLFVSLVPSSPSPSWLTFSRLSFFLFHPRLMNSWHFVCAS